MFGYHEAKRERKRAKKENQNLINKQKSFSEESMKHKQDQELQNKNKINEHIAQSKATRESGYNQGLQNVKNLYNDNSIVGLNPEKRKALQYEANRGIQRNMQTAERKLLGEQGQRGIAGKSGVGYAQQRDLQRMGMEAQSGVHRDLDKLNADLELKNKAAHFAGAMGEAAQAQLDRQLALDEMNYEGEKNRQRELEDEFLRQYRGPSAQEKEEERELMKQQLRAITGKKPKFKETENNRQFSRI